LGINCMYFSNVGKIGCQCEEGDYSVFPTLYMTLGGQSFSINPLYYVFYDPSTPYDNQVFFQKFRLMMDEEVGEDTTDTTDDTDDSDDSSDDWTDDSYDDDTDDYSSDENYNYYDPYFVYGGGF